MEAIPKEVVEMAEDFINHLSLKETGDMMKDFLLEQLVISNAVIKAHTAMKDQELAKKCNLLYLIIYRCYKYYGIKFPVISYEIIVDTQKQFENLYLPMMAKKQTYHELLNEFKAIIKQDNLMDYIILNLEGTPENPVSYLAEIDKNVAINEMILVMLCFNNEIKKYISDEIN